MIRRPPRSTLFPYTPLSRPRGGAAGSNNTATTTSNGVATFSGFTLTGTAGSYTLSFGATGLTPASSGPIALSAGDAASIAANGGGGGGPGGGPGPPPPPRGGPGRGGGTGGRGGGGARGGGGGGVRGG